ncbi:Uncharacterized protein T03_6035 [Trichinella britovi]|uniref:Large ribosomal subunit protein mL44 endonuclease domain-containing protein n=1 Tax=Trichinella britovi TaxID=45882 RepID=A0A0V1DJJ1_TRIBR|nr:Uncharacterized protein T03_6035 [Trichinella britovi]
MTRIWRYWDSRNSWDRFYKTCSVQHGAWHNSQHFLTFLSVAQLQKAQHCLHCGRILWILLAIFFLRYQVPPRPETAQYGNHVNESVEQPMRKMVEQPITEMLMSSKAIKEMAWSPVLFFIKRYLALLPVGRDEAASHSKELMEAVETPVCGDFNHSRKMAETAGFTADGSCIAGERLRHLKCPLGRNAEVFVGADGVVRSAKMLMVALISRQIKRLLACRRQRYCRQHKLSSITMHPIFSFLYSICLICSKTFFPMPFSLIGRILSERIVTLRTISCRYKKKWYRDYIRDLWGRRVLLGPDKDVPRSSFPSWNYNAELFALKSRIGTNLNDDTLRRALIDRSYVIREIDERKQLLDASSNVEFTSSVLTDIQDNTDFIRKGSEFLSAYVKAYLRYHLPRYPEEGIQ